MSESLLQDSKISIWDRMTRRKTSSEFKSLYKKNLSLSQLIMFGIANTVGAGIFSLTGIAVKFTGPSLFITFAITGAICFITATMYGELAARYPSNGSCFSYVYATFGEFAAWIAGWVNFAGYGYTASGLTRALSQFICGLSLKLGIPFPTFLTNFSLLGIKECNPLASVFVIGVMYINLKGTKTSSDFNFALTSFKLVAIAFIIIVAFTLFNITNFTPFVTEEHGWNGTLQGTTVLFFSMIGFDFISTIVEESRNSDLDVPIAMRETVIYCCCIYILLAISLTGIGFGQDKQFFPETAIADTFQIRGLDWMSFVIYICAIISMMASVSSNFMGFVRLLQAFARDGFIPQMFNECDIQTGIPNKTCYVSCVVLCFISFFFDFEELAVLLSLGGLLVYSLVLGCGIKMRYIVDIMDLNEKNEASSWVFIYEICAFVSSFMLKHGVWWQITLVSIGMCIIPFYKLYSFNQVNLPQEGQYRAPYVPILPCIGIYFNFILAWETPYKIWGYLLLYVALGTFLYFSYGVKHSKII